MVQASADNLPFPDKHFDAIFVAQAWHWFANIEDADEPWVCALRAIYEPYDKDVPQYRKRWWTGVFDEEEAKALFQPSPPPSAWFKHANRITRDKVFALARSKSYISCLDEDERVRIDARIEAMLGRYPELFGEGRLREDLPYQTEVVVSHAQK